MNVAMKVRNSYRDQARPFDGPGFFYSRGQRSKRMHSYIRLVTAARVSDLAVCCGVSDLNPVRYWQASWPFGPLWPTGLWGAIFQ